MQKVRTTTAIPDKPAYTAGGTPGYFTEGNPAASLPATVPGAEFFNMLQGELCNVIEGAVITLDPEDDTQLLAAILALIAANAPTPGAATEEAAGIAPLATEAEALAGTDDATIITPAKLAAALAALGGADVEEFYLDGGSIIPAITDGAALAVEETSTNKLTQGFLSFQGSTADTHGFFSFRPPSNWDGGTFRAKVIWRGASGCSDGDNVRFYFAAAAAGDGDVEDLALGTAVTIDDTVNTDSTKRNITAASAAITPSGPPAVGDKITFRVSRDYDYGAQPMSEAAQVEAVILQFGITGNIAAW